MASHQESGFFDGHLFIGNDKGMTCHPTAHDHQPTSIPDDLVFCRLGGRQRRLDIMQYSSHETGGAKG
jgi:hypothetical protein